MQVYGVVPVRRASAAGGGDVTRRAADNPTFQAANVPSCKRHAIEFGIAAYGKPGSQNRRVDESGGCHAAESSLARSEGETFDGRNLNGSPWIRNGKGLERAMYCEEIRCCSINGH
jgi:hypothetical protein